VQLFFGQAEQTLLMQEGVLPLHDDPQCSVPPHPSGMSPQFFPAARHVVGEQHAPLWQTPDAHVPQWSVCPHPSGMSPQVLASHAFGVHGWQTFPAAGPEHFCVGPQALTGQAILPLPHWFSIVPHALSHAGGTGQAPQSIVPPHPSASLPHKPGPHCSGVQPQVCVVALHAFPLVHPPQSIVPVCPQPMAICPQRPLQSACVNGVHALHVSVEPSQICPAGHAPQL
jgi:hypothetical protein